MAGCFGSDPYDRYVEAELYRYLDRLDAEDEDEYERAREERLQRLYEEEEFEQDMAREAKWEQLEKSNDS